MDVNRELRNLAEVQYGLVGRRQAHMLGIGTAEIAHRVRNGDLIELSPEVLRIGGSAHSEATLAMAAVLDSPPGAVLSHRSAAAWWDLPGFTLDSPVHVTVPRQGVRSRGRLAIVHYQKDMPLDQLLVVRDVPVCSPALTMFHIAAVEHPARLERAVDSAWSMRLLDGRTMTSLLERLAVRGRNGIRAMREILETRGPDYVPPESGNEARFEKILRRNALPVPERQVKVGDEFLIGRVDYLYRELGGVVEILSRRYHSSRIDIAADEARFRRLEGIDLPVLPIWDYQIWEQPDAVAAAVWDFVHDLLGRKDASTRRSRATFRTHESGMSRENGKGG